MLTAIRNTLDALPVSVAEVEHQDKWQRATFGVAVVAPQASQLEKILSSVRNQIDRLPDVELLRHDVTHLETPL